jgi:plasmid stabilization system protein ParE
VKYKVIIQPAAKTQFRRIHAYLREEFGAKAARQFKDSFGRIVNVLSENPRMFEAVPDRQNVRKCSALTPSIIYYSVNEKGQRVEVVAMFDGRSDRKMF